MIQAQQAFEKFMEAQPADSPPGTGYCFECGWHAAIAFINAQAVHLSSGGRDPDEKCYTKRDVEALIAITRATEKMHEAKRS